MAVKARQPRIPVYRPRLPAVDRIAPYLETLDQTRVYSNYGPLERRFAAAMSRVLHSETEIVATANSGTAALAGAIIARAGRASASRPLCLCPAYTFVATAAAIEQCGYQVHFIDVDMASWQSLPDTLLTHAALRQVGLIVPVAPYGRGVLQEPWQRFETQTGIPVVIDAAAALENLVERADLYLGSIPVVLSFHATKVFATGEGGAVVTTDRDLMLRSIQAMNFGFMRARRCDIAGFNGKMSEYHAAVGLAELDGWNEKQAAHKRVSALYRDSAIRHGLGQHLLTAPLIASCYTLFEATSAVEASSVGQALDDAGVEHRYWYGLGLHREPYFADARCDALPGVDSLAPRVMGLPMAIDLEPDEIEHVVAAVARSREQTGA